MKNRKHGNILFLRCMDENTVYANIDVVCRGCSMRGRELIWRSYLSSISDEANRAIDNSYLTLEEEPGNRYDPNAIMVVSRGEIFGTVGYIGKEYTGKVKEVLQRCGKYRLDILDKSQVGGKEISLSLRWTEKGEKPEN